MTPPPKKPVIELPDNVMRVKARGKIYFYHQIGRGTAFAGKRTRIDFDPHDPKFLEEVTRLNGFAPPPPEAGTFDDLIPRYLASSNFLSLKPRTQDEYNRHITEIKQRWGKKKVAGVRPKHVAVARDKLIDTPAKANHRVAVLSALFSFGLERDFCTINPAAGIKKLKKGDGYAPWEWPDIEHLRTIAPSHLWQAAAGAIYTGQRQSDVLAMMRSDIRSGEIRVVQDKTGKHLWIPIHRDLQAIIDDMPKTSVYLFTNARGLPWKSGFKASWQKLMNRPEMARQKEKRLVFHGFRKSAVVLLLEAGCTDAQVSAITGQSRQMVEHYAKQVNQRRLARQAIKTWEDSGK